MNHSITDYLKAFGLLLLYMSPVLIAGYFIIYKLGKRDIIRRSEYEYRYREINRQLSDGLKMQHKDYFRLQIESLEALPYKNDEKTEVLWNRYLMACEALKEEPEPVDHHS